MINLEKNIIKKVLATFIILLFSFALLAQKNKSDDEVSIEANTLFNKKEYQKAFPLYSHLLSLHSKDPFYSYRFGVCLLYTDRRDPEAPIKYMKQSLNKLEGEDALMVYYHMGVANHQAYRFNEAIDCFAEFKEKASQKHEYFYYADKYEKMCRNGIMLLQNVSDLWVQKKYEANLSNFFKSYDLSKFGGRIGPKPEFLKTKIDKKRNEFDLVFVSNSNNEIYYSSYGDKKSNQRDIYKVKMYSNGSFSKPEILSSVINTEYDENYPYLLPDGKTLYFCSKGHNSMGGYDIFRSNFDEETQDWSKPVNVDFAINTPFDDILFITDPMQKYAWFSSHRNSNDGNIMVYMVRIDKRIEDVDNSNMQLIAAKNIDYNDANYLKTIEFIQNKSNLDVNSVVEEEDVPEIVAESDNKKYNIPENPTQKQLEDITYMHVNSIDSTMIDFRKKRDAVNLLFELNKTKSEDFNKKGNELNAEAANEANMQNRKKMQEQANLYFNQSSILSNEAEMAKKMLNKYSAAAYQEEKNLNKIKEDAGSLLKLINSRKLDTSVVLLKKMIDDVNSMKQNITEADYKISGNAEFASIVDEKIKTNNHKIDSIEKNISDLNAQKKTLEDKYSSTLDDNQKIGISLKIEEINKKIAQENTAKKDIEKDIAYQKTELAEFNADRNDNSKLSVNVNKIYNNEINNIPNIEDFTIEQQNISLNEGNTDDNSNANNYAVIKPESSFSTNAKNTIKVKLDSLKNYEKNIVLKEYAVANEASVKLDEYNKLLDEWNKAESANQNVLADKIKGTHNELKELNEYKKELRNDKLSISSAINNLTDVSKKVDLKSIDSARFESQLIVVNEVIQNLNNKQITKVIEAEKEERDDIKAEISKIEAQHEAAINDMNAFIADKNEYEAKLSKTKNSKKRRDLQKMINSADENSQKMKEQADDLSAYISELEQKLDNVEKKTSVKEAILKYENYSEQELKQKIDKKTLNNLSKDIVIPALPEFKTDEKQDEKDLSSKDLAKTEDVSKKNISLSFEEQDLVQSKFYKEGAEAIFVRIAVLKEEAKKTENNNALLQEISMLEQMMNGYNKESEAYKKNVENNLSLHNKPEIQLAENYLPKDIIDFHLTQYQIELKKSDSLNAKLINTSEKNNYDKLQKQIDNIDESSRRHYLMAHDIYGVWNNSEFEKNSIAIEKMGVKNLPELNYAKEQMIEARKIRSSAFFENNFLKQKELTEIALAKEKEVIEIQRKILLEKNINNVEYTFSEKISEIEKAAGSNIETFSKSYVADANISKEPEKVTQKESIAENINEIPKKDIEHSVKVNDEKQLADLYYRIQFAASRTEVDTTVHFRGMNSIVDRSGVWFQYMTGYFDSYNLAFADLNKVKAKGYADAFIVAYLNGKRVPIYEARRMERGDKPKVVATEIAEIVTAEMPKTTTASGNISVNSLSGLVYSVQVGVYAKTRNSQSLFGISPLIEEQMNNGYYRYYAGVFDNLNDANLTRNKIRNNGVPDAFVVILYNGKKITQREAEALQAQGIRFDGKLNEERTLNAAKNAEKVLANAAVQEEKSPIKVIYKVQIGAYSQNVPVEAVNAMIDMAGYGIENFKNENGLTIYTVGNFDNYIAAEKKCKEVAEKGLKDAFVTAYLDGKKITLNEAKKITE